MNEKLTLLFLFVAAMVMIASMKTTRKKQILLLGDSITLMGNLHGGFIALLQEKLQQANLDDAYTFKGSGIAGNTLADLHERAGKDAVQQGPYMVVLLIGINDVWHNHTNPATFAATYTDLVNNLRQADIHVITCTLPVIGEHMNGNPHNEAIDNLSQWIRLFALEQRMLMADVRQAFTQYLQQHNAGNAVSGILTTDGVHLNANGNQLLANTIWQTLQPWLVK
jgi:lysophospholipase L1-like esterase